MLLAFLIGLVSGSRSLTAPAIVACAAHWNWLPLGGTPLSALASIAAVAVLTLLALVELIVDKLPGTPPRTAPPALIARIVMGALSGAAIAASHGHSIALGAALGGTGGIAGAYAGYEIRSRLVKTLRVPDLPVALLEDAVAIAAGILLVTPR